MVVVLSAPREVLATPRFQRQSVVVVILGYIGAPRRSPVRPVGYALRRGNYRSAVISVPRSGLAPLTYRSDPSSVPAQEILLLDITGREILMGVRAGYRKRPTSRGVPGSLKCPV
ncbi:hypothetical protein DPMN_127560 [Dreissena polymorpha]|uniref:Uncharacterized protein n=1 Tax=Dreissena polymorpha TaxID=45954 RepID=A0A9D4JWL5_DREPO|nr:hypothetical protein DPMN_127560 [Dreissena polymorpha]